MEFLVNKFVVKKFDDSLYINNLLEELTPYTFKGKVDFTCRPACIYSTKDKFVMKDSEHPDYILNDKKIKVNEDDMRIIQVGEVKLTHKFSIQDFFNQNKDAYCIVFYTPDGQTIFHQGNKIRVYIDHQSN